MTGTTEYTADVLGGGFEAREIVLHADAISTESLVATLIRLGQPTRRRALLYVHGFSDYFFQADHARTLAEQGDLDFYAVDLRRYGRSLRPGHTPGAVRDLAEYDEELAAAVRIIRAEGHDHVALLGHSTGGLIASLFVRHHPGTVDALVLNSPWFDINDSTIKRLGSGPMAAAISQRDPDRLIARMSSAYTSSIHRSTGGDWSFDLDWKPLTGFSVRAGWLAAVRRAQREVARGLDLRLPVLMCTSSRSGGTRGRRPNAQELLTSDTVLDVAHMWSRVSGLGDDITLRTVPGGLHDLALSAPGPRADYERSVLDWLARRLP